MNHNIACHRCGEPLAALSLPFSRRDECPHCSASLHVCRLCVSFDPTVADQCREDDAERVRDKDAANFCDYFAPSESAFDPAAKQRADNAEQALDALFDGDAGNGSDMSSDVSAAEDLFK